MTKKLFDFTFALLLTIIFSPIIVLFSLLIWLYDFRNPFFVAPRVGQDNIFFPMIKFRTMIAGADKTGVDSTADSDKRITPIGNFIRRYKIDELPNLFNILLGKMSFVGPRPNVSRETSLYTSEEKELLSVKPGITDLASIVFSDEGTILKDSTDPDLAYNQLIRPWKSRLGIFYINNMSFRNDLMILSYTILNFISRKRVLNTISTFIERNGAASDLVKVALRETALKPAPPPGAKNIVVSR